MMRIGFIGTGHIAAPIIRFLAAKGHQITVSERNADVSAALAASHGVQVAGNQAVVEACDIVFLCVRPHVAEAVIDPLEFRAAQKIISVMAGVPLKQLASLCAPATDITMTIPLGYLEQGGCPLPACPGDAVLKTLFEPENPVIEVSGEAAFNQHFAVCAFVPGMLDLMATATEWLAARTGDPVQAAFYTQHLVTGFLGALPEGRAQLLAQERDALATEGTISLMMTQGLREANAHSALRQILDAIGARLGETS